MRSTMRPRIGGSWMVRTWLAAVTSAACGDGHDLQVPDPPEQGDEQGQAHDPEDAQARSTGFSGHPAHCALFGPLHGPRAAAEPRGRRGASDPPVVGHQGPAHHGQRRQREQAVHAGDDARSMGTRRSLKARSRPNTRPARRRATTAAALAAIVATHGDPPGRLASCPWRAGRRPARRGRRPGPTGRGASASTRSKLKPMIAPMMAPRSGPTAKPLAMASSSMMSGAIAEDPQVGDDAGLDGQASTMTSGTRTHGVVRRGR